MIRLAAALVTGSLLAASALVRPARAAEPTYTVTLPDKRKLHVTVSVQPTPNGGRLLRVAPLPQSVVKSDAVLSSELALDVSGTVQRCHVQFGPPLDTTPVSPGSIPDTGVDLVAERTEPGVFNVQSPKRSGVLGYGAPLVSPLASLIFLGCYYDWKKGGGQNVVWLEAYQSASPQLYTVTLSADGAQTLNLSDGPVKTRRLKYHAPLAFLPEKLRDGVIFIGPMGETLQSDIPVFGDGSAIKATGAATLEGRGRSFVVRYEFGGFPSFALRAVDNGPNGWEARMETMPGAQKIGSVWTDTAFRVRRVDAPIRSRAYRAEVSPSEIRWTIGGAEAEPAATTANAWFAPFWMITDAWEGRGAMFGDLVVGAKGDGTYFPLFNGQTTGSAFTLLRLPDVSVNAPQGESVTLHHYRFDRDNKSAYELYTDGSRLVLFTGSDATTITRDGWEAFAATIKPPVVTP